MHCLYDIRSLTLPTSVDDDVDVGRVEVGPGYPVVAAAGVRVPVGPVQTVGPGVVVDGEGGEDVRDGQRGDDVLISVL